MSKLITITKIELEKFASSGGYTDEIQNYIKQVKKNPDSKYTYFVATPLGASEYWGANANGDIFPETALNPKEKNADWGHKTFEDAKLYRKHKNKVEDELAIGDIPLSSYNTDMHRVEVVGRLDREKAPELAERIDRGDMPGTSMGCRLKDGDVCTVCGNIATKPAEYCEHLRLSMGSLDKHGNMIGAINRKPLFFDYSLEVAKPAAGESVIFEKIASIRKVNGVSVPYIRWKQPEVISRPNVKLDRIELDIPDPLIEKLARHDFKEILSTSNFLGIVLKPHEFQKLILANIDDQRTKAELISKVFEPSNEITQLSFGPQNYNEKIAKILNPLFQKRTGFEPYVEMRKYADLKEKKYKKSNSSLFKKIAALYNGYRQELVSNLTKSNIEKVLLHNPSILDELLETNFVLIKTAAEIDLFGRMLGEVPLTYFKTVFL